MAETNIKDFLMETVGSPNREEEVKLKRFKSPFKIRGLDAEEISEIRKQATRRVLNKRTHQYESETDQNKVAELTLTASVVSPDLQNEELQKSWGCLGDPTKLLKKMLYVGEYSKLSNAVMDASGMNEDADNPDDLIETAKN